MIDAWARERSSNLIATVEACDFRQNNFKMSINPEWEIPLNASGSCEGFLWITRRTRDSVSLVKGILEHYEMFNQHVASCIRDASGRILIETTNAANGQQLYASVSHTHHFTAASVALRPIGIDMEVIRPEPFNADIPSLMNQSFSESERNFLAMAKDDTYWISFWSIWCSKEAWMKRSGLEIAGIILSELSVTIECLPTQSSPGKSVINGRDVVQLYIFPNSDQLLLIAISLI